VLPVFSLQSDDFTTGTTDVGVDIECLPQVINRGGPGHSPDINKNANVGLEDRSKGVEEPTMRVDLFLVFLFQTEQDLDWDVTAFGPLNGERGRIDGY